MSRSFSSRYTHRAFTILEILIVILMIGIIFTVSSRVMGNAVDNARYEATMKEMDQIKRALIGDANIVKGNSRVDFGYFGKNGAFPASGNLAALSTEFPTNADFTNDAWGNAYNWNGSVLTSYGKDGAAGGTGLNTDITLTIPTTMYTSNEVRINVFDLNGNVLRGNDAGDTLNQISSVTLTHTQTAAVETTTLTYGCVFTRASGVEAGVYTLTVNVATGAGGANGSKDWRPYLNNGNTSFQTEVVIYPKADAVTPQSWNYIAVRLPGALDPTEL